MTFKLMTKGEKAKPDLLTIYGRLEGAYARQMRKVILDTHLSGATIFKQMIQHCLDDLAKKS
jgi:hypothetical protein